MQIENHAVDPSEDGIASHDPNMVHGAGVAGDRHTVLFVRLGGFLSAHQRDGIFGRHVEALDRCRTLDRCGPDLAAQRPHPFHRPADLLAQGSAEPVELVKARLKFRRDWGGGEQHDR